MNLLVIRFQLLNDLFQIATEEETERSKDETKNKIHKKMKYLNKIIADDCSKEINIGKI